MADNTCSYLLDEYPLLVSPMLAKTIGLNEAVFLQCLHNQLKSRSQEQGGVRWYRLHVERMVRPPAILVRAKVKACYTTPDKNKAGQDHPGFRKPA